MAILDRLDDSEKGDKITDEELKEIGVAYGSREKYEEAMREIRDQLSGSLGRVTSISGSVDDRSAKIRSGTTTVPLGNLPKIKKLNIVGKEITSADDAAKLFSSFRDPRIEIFNIAYTSPSGEVLAHSKSLFNRLVFVKSAVCFSVAAYQRNNVAVFHFNRVTVRWWRNGLSVLLHVIKRQT